MADDPDLTWETTLLGGRGRWRAAVLQLSDRVELRRRATSTLEYATPAHVVVSRTGSIAIADVIVDSHLAFTAVSVYAALGDLGRRGYADGSAHRILSDLSALAGNRRERLIVAGDWNLLRGYGEHGDPYWKERYDTVFDRAEALGLRFVALSTRTGDRPILADRAAARQPLRSDLPPRPTVPHHRDSTTRLRVHHRLTTRPGPRARP